MKTKIEMLDKFPYCSAYHSDGLEFNGIDYSGDYERALIINGTKVHLVKIHYAERPYINIEKRRYYLDEFIRI